MRLQAAPIGAGGARWGGPGLLAALPSQHGSVLSQTAGTRATSSVTASSSWTVAGPTPGSSLLRAPLCSPAARYALMVVSASL